MSTVRIGTLILTEGVGPADDLEQASLGEGLDEPTVPRQHPCVVDSIPCRTRRVEVAPKAFAETESTDERLIASLSAAEETLTLISACARASDRRPLGEVDDMIGARPLVQEVPRMVSWIAVIAQSMWSGTGPLGGWMATVRVRCAVSVRLKFRSPSVADMRRNCVCGRSRSGTCQAQPRSGLRHRSGTRP